jgi:hypothetical protein
MAPEQAEQKRVGSYGTLVPGEVKAQKDKRLVGPFLIWLKFEDVQGLWRPALRFFAAGLMPAEDRRRVAAVRGLLVIRAEYGPRASAAHVRCSPKATVSHQNVSRR